MRVWTLLGVGLLLAACSSSQAPVTTGDMDSGSSADMDAGGTDAGATGPTADAACAAEAQARCMKLSACVPTDLQVRYGDEATCVARLKISCLASQAASNTGATPADAQACANAWSALACSDVLSVATPSACLPAMGPGATGSACEFNAQCQSQFCAVTTTSLCGKCEAQPIAGSSCSMLDNCGRTLTCVRSTETCTTPGAQGSACDTMHPCSAGFSCVGAMTGKQGTCEADAATVGAVCDSKRLTGPGCDGRLGLYCKKTSTTGTQEACAQFTVVPVGQACGVINGNLVACAGSATCVRPMGSLTGTCQAPAMDGAACDSSKGPFCFTPARCIPTMPGSTAGTCQLPGTAMCGP